MAESMDAKKPTIVVSRCLGFCPCRYNGDVLSSPFVEALKPHVNYITACPEVEDWAGRSAQPGSSRQPGRGNRALSTC